MLDDFLIRAGLAGIGVAVLAAPLGCFIVWRRMAYFGATVAHSGLFGVALGFLFAIDLTLSVLFVAIALAFLLMALQRQNLLPTDTLLGILAHGALAAGLIAASMLGGKRLDLMGYLFGDILAVTTRDLVWIYGGGALVFVTMIWLWRPLLAVSVHEEMAAAEGINPDFMRIAFVLLIAFTVAVAMKIVGILLITSLLIIPAAIARPFSSTPEQMAICAAVVAILGVVLGLMTSFSLDTPAGPSIVAILAIGFSLSLIRLFRPHVN